MKQSEIKKVFGSAAKQIIDLLVKAGFKEGALRFYDGTISYCPRYPILIFFSIQDDSLVVKIHRTIDSQTYTQLLELAKEKGWTAELF